MPSGRAKNTRVPPSEHPYAHIASLICAEHFFALARRDVAGIFQLVQPFPAVLTIQGVRIFAFRSCMLHRFRNCCWVVSVGALLTGCSRGSPRSLYLM